MKILVAIFAYNESEKLLVSVSRHPANRKYDLLIMDDGSDNPISASLHSKNIIFLRNKINSGIGAAMKRVFNYVLKNNYDILVIQAGNNKDNPLEIPRLIEPIISGRADFVQGSRFLTGKSYKTTPFFRRIATQYIHPLLFSVFVGKKLTESTNGFRAFKTTFLKDPNINWEQDWLNRYELEPYLLYKAIKGGYRHIEVSVTKVYPPGNRHYTKMRPVIDWWSILKPVFYLKLGIKK